MGADEFAEWAAFFQLEPWGTEVDDLLNARVCQTVAAGAGVKRPKIADYLLFPDKPTRQKQTPEEMYARLRAIMAPLENSRR